MSTLGKAIEGAMAEAVNAVARESDAIWQRTDLTPATKRKLIDKLNEPVSIKARMLAARAALLPAPPAPKKRVRAAAKKRKGRRK